MNSLVANGVNVDGELVGKAMSRCYSYSVKKMISQGIIEKKYAEPETEVEEKWGSGDGPVKMIRAVVKPQLYKVDR